MDEPPQKSWPGSRAEVTLDLVRSQTWASAALDVKSPDVNEAVTSGQLLPLLPLPRRGV